MILIERFLYFFLFFFKLFDFFMKLEVAFNWIFNIFLSFFFSSRKVVQRRSVCRPSPKTFAQLNALLSLFFLKVFSSCKKDKKRKIFLKKT